jgi:hypothetical protein
MAQTASDKIRALTQRRTSMDAEYSHWEPHFRSIRDAIMPARGRFSLGESRRNSTLNKKIIDSAAGKAHRTLRAGLMSGMTSPSRPWFRLGLFDEDMEDRPDVKQYLETVQRRMYGVLRGSNMYRTFDACYGDIGLYGTWGGLILPSFEDVVRGMAFPMGLYRLSEDENGNISALHYECRRTVRQLVERFGLDNCSSRVKSAWKQNRLDDWIDVHVAVEPRYQRDPISPLARNMPFAIYYWEKEETDQFLEESGFPFNAILGPRWESIIGETYSVSSPGMLALGDCLQLQQQQRDKHIAIQMMARPPMQAPSSFKQGFQAVPGKMYTVDSQTLQAGGLRPTHQVQPDVQALVMDINETRRRISEAFFEDLFLLTIQSDRRNITATEVAERHEEKLIVLGPVLEALDYGLLQPVIETTYGYMQQAGILPEPPEDMEGQALKIEYVSLLAQAQRMVGVAAIERTVGFVGSLAQIKPEALDKINADAMVDEFADQIGPPVKTIRSTEEVASIREQRAQHEQAAQAMQMLESGAGSAKLLSEANERGERALAEQRRAV